MFYYIRVYHDKNMYKDLLTHVCIYRNQTVLKFLISKSYAYSQNHAP